MNHEGDFFRTRLTHTIEVAQVARSVARALGLDEDLTEALALAHDLGHPPFGHAGEEALNAGMKPYGGFDHNAQSLRIVTHLESRYAAFDGLNLTWETLEGLAKHNGPVHRPHAFIAEYDAGHRLDLHTHASAEAQVAAIADDIAYHSHDLDDGLRAGLFGVEEISHLPVVGDALREARLSSLDVPPPELFAILHGNPALLPDGWRAMAGEADPTRAAHTVRDYIAGMTDRFAMDEHRRLTDLSILG